MTSTRSLGYTMRSSLSPIGSDSSLHVAVIGAGLSGLACARRLKDGGCRVVVFEKSRGAGGRAATRRSGTLRFDHGAQYFTVSDPRFARQVELWRKRGLAVPWSGRVVELTAEGGIEEKADTTRFVGVPGMSALGRDLARDVNVHWSWRVDALEPVAGEAGWRLLLDSGQAVGQFQAVVTSAPAPQSAALLDGTATGLSASCQSVSMVPCWAAMAAFEYPLGADFDGAFVGSGPLAWIARESSKPGRSANPECWVLHGDPAWSERQLEDDSGDVARALLSAFFDVTGLAGQEPLHLDAHRWRYARPLKAAGETCLIDAEKRLAVCGDWLGGNRIEAAFLSGCAAAERTLDLLAHT
jgi:renalase